MEKIFIIRIDHEKKLALVGKNQYQIHTFPHKSAGRSAAWLARLPWEQEVAGSNPAAPTNVFPSPL